MRSRETVHTHCSLETVAAAATPRDSLPSSQPTAPLTPKLAEAILSLQRSRWTGSKENQRKEEEPVSTLASPVATWDVGQVLYGKVVVMTTPFFCSPKRMHIMITVYYCFSTREGNTTGLTLNAHAHSPDLYKAAEMRLFRRTTFGPPKDHSGSKVREPNPGP